MNEQNHFGAGASIRGYSAFRHQPEATKNTGNSRDVMATPRYVPDDTPVAKPVQEPDVATDDTPAFVPPHQQVPQKTSFLPDLARYDLTVGEALALFPEHNRRRPSERTLQRYCQDGRFDCYKLKTTRDGKPIFEWIINRASLVTFIKSRPEDDRPDAKVVHLTVNGGTEARSHVVDVPNDMATPVTIGVAKDEGNHPRSGSEPKDVTATPTEHGDAKDDDTQEQVGGPSKVELLIQNAELTAQLEAKDELVGELRADKKFLREQIEHERKNDALLGSMHRETLQTLKAVAVAGRHTKIEMPLPDGEREERPDPVDYEH